MYIKLPNNFLYISNERLWAYLENDVLYVIIFNTVSWERLAANISYAIYGRKTCQYCGKQVKRRKITIDHKFSKNCGGMSIPDNLAPVCEKCNMEKGYLNYRQYKEEFCLLETQEQKDEYREKIDRQNEIIRYEKGFILPEEWIEMEDISKIIGRDVSEEYKNFKKYKSMREFIRKYGNVPKPLVVSRNNFVLEGNTLYLAEKDCGYQYIPIIRLENVVVQF